MDFDSVPQYIQLSMAAQQFGLSPGQLRDRIRYYNKQHPDRTIRREWGLVCVEDLVLMFPSADPEEQSRRHTHEPDLSQYPGLKDIFPAKFP